uniref:Secreted protein n=1 Tax=Tetranychus urticae TaxID=32264 RepID=T1JZH8_TETUR
MVNTRCMNFMILIWLACSINLLVEQNHLSAKVALLNTCFGESFKTFSRPKIRIERKRRTDRERKAEDNDERKMRKENSREAR